MKAEKEKSIRFLTLRAILVIGLVLALLIGLKKTGVLTCQLDVPAQVVEETMGVMGIPAE